MATTKRPPGWKAFLCDICGLAGVGAVRTRETGFSVWRARRGPDVPSKLSNPMIFHARREVLAPSVQCDTRTSTRLYGPCSPQPPLSPHVGRGHARMQPLFPIAHAVFSCSPTLVTGVLSHADHTQNRRL